MCAQETICVPHFFSNFSETPCMKVSFDVRISRWEITFSFIFQKFASTCEEQPFRACSHALGQLIALGQLTDPGVNFASEHGLMFVTVHMNLSLPRGNFERWVPIVQHQVTGLAKVTFLHVNRMQKLPWDKSSLAHTYY